MRILHLDSGREMRGGQWQALRLIEGLSRAAKQAGAIEVVVKVGDQSLIVRLTPSTGVEVPLAPAEEIVL